MREEGDEEKRDRRRGGKGRIGSDAEGGRRVEM